MRVVIAFYRWAIESKLLDMTAVPWQDRHVALTVPDKAGLSRTFAVTTTDLAISNRQQGMSSLEDRLQPLNAVQVTELLRLAGRYTSPELQLMLTFGCTTGMRLGSICDLKIETLERAAPDPHVPGVYWMSIGPAAKPAVATKYDVTGRVLLPGDLRDRALAYACGNRRKRRMGHGHDQLLFLTRAGSPYRDAGDSERSRAVNVAMSRFRRLAGGEAAWLADLKFHQTRATFATSVAGHALNVMDATSSLALVRDLLLHKDEATSLRYIKFIQSNATKISLSKEFTDMFFRLSENRFAGATKGASNA
jgi:integrase